MSKARFAIVGSSIAGSICSIILSRLGFEVTIFEKLAKDAIIDRGVGIWLSPELVSLLIKQDILPHDFLHLNINERPIYVYDTKDGQEKLLISHPVNAVAVHWKTLYDGLKQHRMEDKVVYGSQITNIKYLSNQVELIINDDEVQSFDYCVFADGVNSIGRQCIYPKLQPKFTHTYIWRGTLNRVDDETTAYLLNKGIFHVCERGHLLLYLIPNPGVKNPTTDYKINWLFYEKVDATHELFKFDQESARKNIIKGQMPKNYLSYLHHKAKMYFPEFVSKIILDTKEPFTQALHEVIVPSYVHDNIIFIGDAASVVRPHTAFGSTKAILDAISLGEQLNLNSDINTALVKWNTIQYRIGESAFNLGQKLGELFVTSSPNWNRISQKQIDNIWSGFVDSCWYAVKPTK